MNIQIFRIRIYILLLFINCTTFSTSRNLNNRNNQYDEDELNSDDLLANPGLLEKLTKSQLQNLLQGIEKEENATKDVFSVEGNNINPTFSFDDNILQDLFSEGSSKEDLQTLSDMLIETPPDMSEITDEGNFTAAGEGINSQTQTQSQNVSIVTNIYNQGAGGHHHHKHYHLLLLSDDGQAQELPLDTILDAISSSSSTPTTTSDNNNISNNNSTNQTITISDLIAALNVIKNNNSNSITVSCPPNGNNNEENSASANSDGTNSGNSITTPSTFYQPPPMEENGGPNNGAANTDAHDSNTDNIHLTTAFPNPSTPSSNSLSIDGEASLLPPVVNPPQITNQLVVSNVVVSPSNDNIISENGNVDSLTVKSVFTCDSVSDGATTNFVNPSYPESDTNAGHSTVVNHVCTFLLKIPDDTEDICQVRVDFVDTNMLQPVDGECVRQYLTIRGTIWPMGVTKFCGINRDQHFYIEIDQAHSPKYVEFVVVTVGEASIEGGNFQTSDYNWGLWITQLPCDGSRLLTAPTGCFQYFLESSGIMRSYNYQGGQYLNNQAYRVCILSARGACKIMYHGEGNNSFGLDKFGNYKTSPYWRSGVSSLYCIRDYLRIPDGSVSGYGNTITRDRYCGGRLNPGNPIFLIICCIQVLSPNAEKINISAKNHNAHSTSTVSSPIYGRLITIDFRSGDPIKFPTRHQNGAHDPAALNGFSGISSTQIYNQEHHKPGYSIRYEQYLGNECKPADLSLIGEYDNLN